MDALTFVNYAFIATAVLLLGFLIKAHTEINKRQKRDIEKLRKNKDD